MTEQKQETPTEHSDLVGGSTAARRINCPGSYKRQLLAPPDRGSSYAREGTAFHEMIAQVLDHDKDPAEMLPFTHNQPEKGAEKAWSLTIDKELWDDLGQPALDMYDTFLDEIEADQGKPATFMIEERGAFPGIPGGFGTSDVVFRCGEIGGIWDWKFGRTKVSADNNAQLMFYFSCMLDKYPKFFEGVTRVVLCISQPQVNDQEPETWETDLEDIAAFGDELREAVKLAQTDDAPIEKGSWCNFANCKAVCELHISATTRLSAKMAKLDAFNAAKKTPGGVKKMAVADRIDDMGAYLADLCELGDMAAELAKAAAKAAQNHLENGGKVDGYKLVAKKSPGKEWVADEAIIKQRLRTRGMPQRDTTITKLISPTQAIAKLKKLGKTLPEELYEQKPSSGHTLVKSGDPRDEVASGTEKAAKLGGRLAAALKREKTDE